ncbi:MAG: hypothetical protein ABIO40_02920 [Devosia sp.]
MDQVQRGLSSPSRLGEIYGPDTFLASRPWEGASRWLTSGGAHIEAMTGRHTAFAGEMPDLCHTATRSAVGLQLMRDAGLSPSAAALVYDSTEQYVAHIRALAAEGKRGVPVYRVPEDVLPSASSLVPSELLGYLNDKANLTELAPSEGVPQREVLSGADFATRKWTLPIAVKVATTEANAGGRDIVLCVRPRHLRRAIERFNEAERVVVEQFLHPVRNDSFQVAVMPDGSLGGFPPTLQVTNYRGVHTSSIHDAADPPPAAAQALALAAARRGAELGYRGVCGFDVLTGRDGRSYIVDLNFRICASTGMVLLTPELQTTRKLPVVQQMTAYFGGGIDSFARLASSFVSKGTLVPIGTFDARLAGQGDGCELTLLLFGNDRHEIELELRKLNQLGLGFKGWEPPLLQQIGNALRNRRKPD